MWYSIESNRNIFRSSAKPLVAIAALTMMFGATGCESEASRGAIDPPPTPPPIEAISPVFDRSLPEMSPEREALLASSWEIYKERFIQGDGRVIDREADDRSISEGQAYAMLRAVFADDREIFDKTLQWSESNLERQSLGLGSDRLWAWKWGQKSNGEWGILDPNFASDADIDAIFALILAQRRWGNPEYLDLARGKLVDLWEYSTFKVEASGKRYLLPGPKDAFVPESSLIYLNPSYLAPYAFRVFAQVDEDRDWFALVGTSYEILERSGDLSRVGLPSDWVGLDTQTDRYQTLVRANNLRSQYAFDAYRVWWRVLLDKAWFGAPEATDFLRDHLQYPIEQWREDKQIVAEIDLQGQPLVEYDATAQYAMLYPALVAIEPAIAAEILAEKIIDRYDRGFWDNDTAYYTQNLAWLGLFPPSAIDSQLLQPPPGSPEPTPEASP